jgi:hypothetical protein
MSYSRSLRKRRETGIYIGPTLGKSSPKNSRRGCLCLDSNTYDTKCCDGYLINQGIGKTESVITDLGAFSSGFSDGFDIQITR